VFLLVPAHPGSPRTKGCKTVVVVVCCCSLLKQMKDKNPRGNRPIQVHQEKPLNGSSDSSTA